MTVLTSSTYNYQQGETIIFTVTAYNEIGSSISIANTGNSLGEVVPLTPSTAPVLVTTTTTSITVQMPIISGSNTGGSSILSYNLQVNQGGNSQVYTSIVGEFPYSTTTTYTKNGLTTGITYKFRYRVANAHGWSGFSDPVSILCSTVPG